VLRKILRQSPVEYKQASLGPPLHGAFALFDKQYHLAPPYPPDLIVVGKFWYIIRIYEVGLDSRIDIEEDDQDRVEALEFG
jgi:hypothetical protein